MSLSSSFFSDQSFIVPFILQLRRATALWDTYKQTEVKSKALLEKHGLKAHL